MGCAMGTIHKGLEMGWEDQEISGRIENIRINSLVEINQNTKKNPGDISRLD